MGENIPEGTRFLARIGKDLDYFSIPEIIKGHQTHSNVLVYAKAMEPDSTTRPIKDHERRLIEEIERLAALNK